MFHFRMSLRYLCSHPGGYISSGQLDVSLKLRQEARITHLVVISMTGLWHPGAERQGHLNDPYFWDSVGNTLSSY